MIRVGLGHVYRNLEQYFCAFRTWHTHARITGTTPIRPREAIGPLVARPPDSTKLRRATSGGNDGRDGGYSRIQSSTLRFSMRS